MNQLPFPSSLNFKDIFPDSDILDAYFSAIDTVYQPENAYEEEQFCQTRFDEQCPTLSLYIDHADISHKDINCLQELDEQFRILQERGNRIDAYADIREKRALVTMIVQHGEKIQGKYIPDIFHTILFSLLGIKNAHIEESICITKDLIDRVMKK